MALMENFGMEPFLSDKSKLCINGKEPHWVFMDMRLGPQIHKEPQSGFLPQSNAKNIFTYTFEIWKVP
jgi:hypothetical protein